MKDLVRIFEESPDFRSYAVSIALDAIWNLVEVVGQPAVRSMADDQQVVMGLRKPFENVIQKGYKLEDKCLRNELAILINYLVMDKISHDYLFIKDEEDGKSFIQSLMYYATVDEFYGIEQGDNI
jgi:cilia- and flagella-associated protein 69